LWASRGEQIEPGDLPALLRATLLDVRSGAVEPGVATAIAALAKASVAVSQDLELEARLARLEAAAGIAAPANVTNITSRKVGA
jgi:hypothetical protein